MQAISSSKSNKNDAFHQHTLVNSNNFESIVTPHEQPGLRRSKRISLSTIKKDKGKGKEVMTEITGMKRFSVEIDEISSHDDYSGINDDSMSEFDPQDTLDPELVNRNVNHPPRRIAMINDLHAFEISDSEMPDQESVMTYQSNRRKPPIRVNQNLSSFDIMRPRVHSSSGENNVPMLNETPEEAQEETENVAFETASIEEEFFTDYSTDITNIRARKIIQKKNVNNV